MPIFFRTADLTLHLLWIAFIHCIFYFFHHNHEESVYHSVNNTTLNRGTAGVPFCVSTHITLFKCCFDFFSSHNLRITYMCTWSAQKQQVPANQRQCLVTSRTHQESCANNDGRKIQGHQTLWRVILQKVKLYHTLVRVCCYGVCDVCYGEWICAQMGLFVHVRVWKAERLYIKSPLKRGYSGETFCFFLVR